MLRIQRVIVDYRSNVFVCYLQVFQACVIYYVRKLLTNDQFGQSNLYCLPGVFWE